MMRKSKLATLAMTGIVAAGLAASSIAAERGRSTNQTWLNASLSAEQRADALLRAMTLEEKAGQVSQQFMFGKFEQFAPIVRESKVGSLLFVTDPAIINRLQKVAVEETRLKIPLMFGYDVIHGFRTIFPVPLGNAASWDPEGVERAQTVAAAEARASGIHWAFSPMLDVARDPRWGRIVEGPGEDPFLASALARAQVKGFQGTAIGTPGHVIAGPKHFAGYAAADGGRDYDGVNLSDSQLYNVILTKRACNIGTRHSAAGSSIRAPSICGLALARMLRTTSSSPLAALLEQATASDLREPDSQDKQTAGGATRLFSSIRYSLSGPAGLAGHALLGLLGR